jgi:hypothetical protein
MDIKFDYQRENIKALIVRSAPSMAQNDWQVGLKKRHITGLYMLTASRRFGLRKIPVGALRLCGIFLRHIFASPGTLRVPLSGLQKRHIQPERYTTFFNPNLSSQVPSMAPEILPYCSFIKERI